MFGFFNASIKKKGDFYYSDNWLVCGTGQSLNAVYMN